MSLKRGKGPGNFSDKRIDTVTDRQNPFSLDENLLQEWIDRIVDNDQVALGLLYDSLLGQVYGLALRILHSKQLAEEVVQETFWQVWRQAPRYDPDRGSVKNWVLTITRSRSLDILRSIEPNELELNLETSEPTISSYVDIPQELLATMQQGHRLNLALESLGTESRHLVSLAFLRGLSHYEISKHTGLPLGSVKSHIRRALKIMREILSDDVNEVKK